MARPLLNPFFFPCLKGETVIVAHIDHQTGEKRPPFSLMKVARTEASGWVSHLRPYAGGKMETRAKGLGVYRAVLHEERIAEVQQIVARATDFNELREALLPFRDEEFYANHPV